MHILIYILKKPLLALLIYLFSSFAGWSWYKECMWEWYNLHGYGAASYHTCTYPQAIVFSGCGTSGRIVRDICGSGDACSWVPWMLNYWSKLELFRIFHLYSCIQAWLCSHAFNSLLRQLGKEPCFGYLISGGDESLIISNELPEDDPPLGKPRIIVWTLTCLTCE